MSRLLFQSHTGQVLGGAEMSLLAIMDESVSRGYEVHVITPTDGDFVSKAKQAGCLTHVVKSYWWTLNRESEFSPRLHKEAIKKTTDLVGELKPLICITNTIVTPWLAVASAKVGIPHAWILREYADANNGLKFWAPTEKIIEIVDHLSDLIFVNSPDLKAYYRPMVKKNDISILLPVVKTPKPTTKKSPFAQGVLRLVCVGTVRLGKGQLDAVKATARLIKQGIQTQLLIVGNEPDRAYAREIKKYIKRNGLNKSVRLCGYQENPADFVGFADMALVCSINEGFGRATIEPLLQGVPVIGTDSGGTRSILASYKQDLLYRYGDVAELAAKIKSLNANKKHTRLMAQNLKKEVTQKYLSGSANAELFSFLSAIKSNHRVKRKNAELVTKLLEQQSHHSFWPVIKMIKRKIISGFALNTGKNHG